MTNIIAFCEATPNGLRSNALVNIAFARQAAELHGGQVIALLMGTNLQKAAEQAATYVPKVVTVDDTQLDTYLAETYAPVITRIVQEQNAAIVSATASTVGKDFMPRVAMASDAAMASDISGIVAKNQFVRPILAGNAYATVEIATPVICVTVRQSEFTPAEPLSSVGSIESASAGDIHSLGAEVVRVEATQSDRPDLNDASIVVSGGRGLGKDKRNADATPQDNFTVLEKLAETLGAALGASRAVTDAGWVPADWQVGQTGKIVAPDLYFAVGISGAIQHLAGMKGSKTIVAINKDAEAPIFEIADYGIVAQWEDTLPELIEKIGQVKTGA